MIRLAGAGGRECHRQAYTHVFTVFCQASHRTLDKAQNSGKLFIAKSLRTTVNSQWKLTEIFQLVQRRERLIGID